VGVGKARAFTLVELIVAISIISMLMAILVPATNLVRRQARGMLGMYNQREVSNALMLFSMDNNDRYPQSVATVGTGDEWSWSDPTKMIGITERSPQLHRSMSAYLAAYIPDAKTVFCPSAPRRYKYLQEAWDAGDTWNNPDTSRRTDPFSGTYCFYWNYIGYLSESNTLFRGPTGPASMGRYNQLLMSDYFGYDHWRSPGAFGSCERLKGAEIVEETQLLSSYWAVEGDPEVAMPEVKLRASYTDGHVETYSSSDVVAMKISASPEGAPPYPDGSAGGTFFVPENVLP
jgi:prepilin-type N-terminal cleavage/methylation domain-containing protein